MSVMPADAFQSTLPLRGVTFASVELSRCNQISIHTPLAGSDAEDVKAGFSGGISIHTPLAGSDR